jgi:hypothetical protein
LNPPPFPVGDVGVAVVVVVVVVIGVAGWCMLGPPPGCAAAGAIATDPAAMRRLRVRFIVGVLLLAVAP